MRYGILLVVLFVLEWAISLFTGKESVMRAYDWFLVFGLVLLGVNEIINKSPN